VSGDIILLDKICRLSLPYFVFGREFEMNLFINGLYHKISLGLSGLGEIDRPEEIGGSVKKKSVIFLVDRRTL
jgi:hypothetical protein